MSWTVEQVIGRYIELRDEKETIAERHKAELAPIHTAQEKIEAWLQAKLIELGADNIKTDAGTAFRTSVTSAKVVNWEAVLARIVDAADWDMLVRNVNKTAVVDFVSKYGQPPDGVEMTVMHKVNVRRS